MKLQGNQYPICQKKKSVEIWGFSIKWYFHPQFVSVLTVDYLTSLWRFSTNKILLKQQIRFGAFNNMMCLVCKNLCPRLGHPIGTRRSKMMPSKSGQLKQCIPNWNTLSCIDQTFRVSLKLQMYKHTERRR